MFNKKIGFGLIGIFLVSMLCFSSIWALENTIKSASEPDYPPFCVVDANGNADGFSIELLRAALKAEELDVSFYVAPWDQIKQELADGKIQVLPLVGKTPERELIYDFTEPYLTFYGAIFVRTGDSRIKTDRDLWDKEIVVLKGDNAEEYVRRENVSTKIITTQTYTEAFQQLSEGKYDAVIAQQRMGTNLVKTLGIKNVVVVDYRLDAFRQDFTFAVKEGDSELLSKLDSGLASITRDGTFDSLYKKWFIEPEAKTSNLVYLMGAIIIIIIIIMVIFYIQKKNNKQEK
jgi:ABC-type amino acid transport substrate-binding protein